MHEEVRHVAHRTEVAFGRDVFKRRVDIALGAVLAEVVEVEKAVVVFDRHAIDRHFGMLSVQFGIGTAEKDVALPIVLFGEGEEEYVDVATSARTGDRVVTGEAHTLDEAQSESLGIGFLSDRLEHFGLVVVVIAGAVG